MPKYFFRLVNATFTGPNTDAPEDCAGAYVNCIVQASNHAAATELLVVDLKEHGFIYESVEEIMDLAEAVKKLDLDPEHEGLNSDDPVVYDAFHCYPETPDES